MGDGDAKAKRISPEEEHRRQELHHGDGDGARTSESGREEGRKTRAMRYRREDGGERAAPLRRRRRFAPRLARRRLLFRVGDSRRLSPGFVRGGRRSGFVPGRGMGG